MTRATRTVESHRGRGPGPEEPARIDTAAVWENLCSASELSEECEALAAGLAGSLGNAETHLTASLPGGPRAKETSRG